MLSYLQTSCVSPVATRLLYGQNISSRRYRPDRGERAGTGKEYALLVLRLRPLPQLLCIDFYMRFSIQNPIGFGNQIPTTSNKHVTQVHGKKKERISFFGCKLGTCGVFCHLECRAKKRDGAKRKKRGNTGSGDGLDTSLMQYFEILQRIVKNYVLLITDKIQNLVQKAEDTCKVTRIDLS